MRAVIPTICLTLLCVFSNTAFALDKQKTLDIQVVHTEYVKLVGSVIGATRTFDVWDIEPIGWNNNGQLVTLGLLGIESNVAGNCTLDFSTVNNFKLRHTVSNKRLARYILRYKGKKIRKNKPTIVLPSCNIAPKALKFRTKGNFRQNREAGFYSDTITITVTTE